MIFDSSKIQTCNKVLLQFKQIIYFCYVKNKKFFWIRRILLNYYHNQKIYFICFAFLRGEWKSTVVLQAQMTHNIKKLEP